MTWGSKILIYRFQEYTGSKVVESEFTIPKANLYLKHGCHRRF
jgi:hypothetical protein